jgi:hypothetical protein
MDGIVRAAIEIELHPNSMNREVPFASSSHGSSSTSSRNLHHLTLRSETQSEAPAARLLCLVEEVYD